MSGPPSPIRNQADLAHLLAMSPSQTDSHVAGLRGKIELIDCDLTDTERESEKLTKKLNKRMSGNRADIQSPSEYFMDKLTRWHSNKKVEKLKCLLKSHLPKVKHLEEDVLSSVLSVTASKAAAFKSANLVLCLVDKQIDYYQQHMNFLEDVINDIRQCDYTIVREISEMKMAFAFSQEIEVRTRSNSRNGTVTTPNPCTVLLKIGVDSTGHVPSMRVLDDDSVIPGFEYLAKPGAGHHASEPDCTVLARSVRREMLPPGVARLTAGEAFDPHAPEYTFPGRPLPSTPTRSISPIPDVPHVPHVPHSYGGIAAEEPKHHDGTDYKRKCLQSYAINIQSLNLTKGGGSDAFTHASLCAHPDKKKKLQEEHDHKGANSPRAFMRAVSDRLSDLTHFKDHKDHRDSKESRDAKLKDLGAKNRSWTNSPSGSEKFDKAEKIPVSDRRMSMGSLTHALTGASGLGLGSNSKDKDPTPAARSLRPISLGGSIPSQDAPHAHFSAIPSSSHSFPMSQSAPVLSGQAVTPRPRAISGSAVPHKETKDLRELNHNHNINHTLSNNHKEQHSSSSASIDSGIAYVDSGSSTASPTSATSRHDAKHATSPDVMSHNSSWSNFSHGSTANNSHNNLPGLHHLEANAEHNERKRVKYAALLHHYPHLFPCLLDPAVKIIARRLNKYLKFKDELSRSLMRAEAVQESETNCLRKMRRMQHDLRDLTLHAAATSSSSLTSPEAANAPHADHAHHAAFGSDMSATSSRPSVGAMGSNNSSGSYSYTLELDRSQSLSHDTHDAHDAHHHPSLSLENHASALDSMSPMQSLLAKAKLTDHDLHDMCSTDDEHEILSQSTAHEHPGAASSSRGAVAGSDTDSPPSPSVGLCLDSPTKTRSTSASVHFLEPADDPTILDSCHDAALVQISAQLLEAAAKSVEQLKLILAEEQDASEQLTRVRHLLSSATHIEEQIQANLSP